MATKKINWILILQGWAILWVVIGHAPLLPVEVEQPQYACVLYRIAYAFHMPLFVFVSGYLFHLTRMEGRIPYAKMLTDKLMRLGIPFVAFTIAAMLFKTLFATEMVRPATVSATEFLNAFLYPGDGPLSELWFVATLMWYFAMRPLWQALCDSPVIAIVALTALFCIPELPTRNLLCYQNVLHYALFFYLGIIAHKRQIFDAPSRSNAIAVCAVIAAGAITLPLSSELLGALCGIAISIVGAKVADRYLPSLFRSFRDYSYQIYLMAIFVQIAVKILCKHGIVPSYAAGFLLCILCGIYLSVAVSLIIKKLNNKYLNLCIGLK